MSRARSDTLPRDRAGQVVRDKYRLVRRIGEGGMGTVYEAEHAVVGRRFALKFLHPDLCDSDDALARFRREAKIAGSLDNEHVAAVIDFDVAEDGSPFIVMEYLEGQSFAELLASEGPLPVPRVASGLKQVCEGLEAAHAAGIIHRDLKPDNLFVVRRKDGRELVKILDFGIAKVDRSGADGSVTRSGATLGTPFYMAPEQARGDKALDHRVDIHAVGVILYELLSGQKPHPGDSYNAILAHILGQRPAPLTSLRAGIPPRLAEIVDACLATEPEQRPASAAALAKELERFAGTEVTASGSQLELRVLSSGTPTVNVEVRSPRRSRALPVALGVSACVGVGAVLWARGGHPEKAEPEVALAVTPAPSGVTSGVAPAPSEALAPSVDGGARARVPPAIDEAPAPSSGHSVGRPAGRPPPERTAAKRPPPKAPKTPAVDVKAAVPPQESPSSAGRRGVVFDTRNPYE